VNQENAFVFLRKVFRLPVTANFFPGSPILDTLMKEVLSSSETFVPSEPHGITSQKMPFFIVTAVKTSNLTQTFIFQKTLLLLQIYDYSSRITVLSSGDVSIKAHSSPVSFPYPATSSNPHNITRI
jgi:hypothetical protein